MSYLRMYWETAESDHRDWGECQYLNHRLVLVTYEWPPKDVRNKGGSSSIRHTIFVFDGSEKVPNRSMGYEPAAEGTDVFLGESNRNGLRLNHGKIPHLTKEEFWVFGFAKLFGVNPPAGLFPATARSEFKNPRWRFWK